MTSSASASACSHKKQQTEPTAGEQVSKGRRAETETVWFTLRNPTYQLVVLTGTSSSFYTLVSLENSSNRAC